MISTRDLAQNVATLGLALTAVAAAPLEARAAAAVSDYTGLSAAFANPSSVGGEAVLSAAISQGAAADLVLQDGAQLTLDLDGHTLDTGSIKLGAGSTLTITDSSAASPGVLTAAAASGDGAGIAVNGATLVIAGRAEVHASARQGTAAGIGGDAAHPDDGTVTITGHARVSASGGQFSAGIGGGDHGTGGTITVGGDAVVQATATDGAGMGGGDYTSGGTIHITDAAHVTATSNVGAGIGGGYWGGNGAAVTIDGSAVVESAGTDSGAGIGGGQAALDTPPAGGNGGAVLVAGSAHVTATGSLGAGIGGGYSGAGGSFTMRDNPVVTATSTRGGAGVGGGYAGAGGDVVLDGGVLTAANQSPNSSSAVGFGRGATSFGSLAINPPATLIIPDGAVLRVPEGVTVTGRGSLHGEGDGSVVNDGAVQLPTANVQWRQLGVLPHSYLVTFDANGGTPTHAVRVFATSFAAGARTVPADPTRADFVFEGWNTEPDGSGENLAFGPETEVSGDLTLYAQWHAAPTPTPTPTHPTPEPPPGNGGHHGGGHGGGEHGHDHGNLAQTGVGGVEGGALAALFALAAGAALRFSARRGRPDERAHRAGARI